MPSQLPSPLPRPLAASATHCIFVVAERSVCGQATSSPKRLTFCATPRRAHSQRHSFRASDDLDLGSLTTDSLPLLRWHCPCCDNVAYGTIFIERARYCACRCALMQGKRSGRSQPPALAPPWTPPPGALVIIFCKPLERGNLWTKKSAMLRLRSVCVCAR